MIVLEGLGSTSERDRARCPRPSSCFMSRAPNDYIYFRRSDSIRLHVKLAVLVLL